MTGRGIPREYDGAVTFIPPRRVRAARSGFSRVKHAKLCRVRACARLRVSLILNNAPCVPYLFPSSLFAQRTHTCTTVKSRKNFSAGPVIERHRAIYRTFPRRAPFFLVRSRSLVLSLKIDFIKALMRIRPLPSPRRLYLLL